MNVIKKMVKKTDSTIAATAASTSTRSSAKDEQNRSSRNRSDSSADFTVDGVDPSLSGRYAYGAAVVVPAREVGKKETEKGNGGISSTGTPVILVAGGKGSRRGRTVVLDTVEVFDPDRCNQAQLCPYTLSTARFSCGAFAVTEDTMCVLGGNDGRAQFLASAELVTPTSCSLLPKCNFDLPLPMASFGVAVVGEKVLVIGGKSANSTLATVFEADLSYFVLAAKGQNDASLGEKNVWQQVKTRSVMHPRHSFSLVVDDAVCFIIGGFDGVRLLDSVVMYNTQQRKFLDHPASLSVPRSGSSSFMMGKNTLVSGGVVPMSKEIDITEVLARLDTDQSDEAFFGLPNLADCLQIDQIVLEMGYKAYAIGQFDFSDNQSPIPTGDIASLDLIPFRSLLRNTKVPRPFPKPVVPDAPANPRIDTDPKILKTTIDNWKKRYDETTEEYRQRVSVAKLNAQMLFNEVVTSLKSEIQKTEQSLASARPDEANSRDQNDVKRVLDYKRKAFELEEAKLKHELQDRIDRRNEKFESIRSKKKELECMISECTIRLQEHGEKIENEFSVWNSTKEKNVDFIESRRDPRPRPLSPVPQRILQAITEDREKLRAVLQGAGSDMPAEVSSEYGMHCTNNFDVKNEIGSGGFGVVYVGIDAHLNHTFAIKRVSVLVTDPQKQAQVLQTFKREISTLKRVRHPNIVALYGYHLRQDCEFSCLIYEHLERGNVATYLKTEAGRISLPYLRRLRIMVEALRALNFLHTCGCEGLEIQHRDIKPHNICLDKKWSAKLIDCGLARFERTEKLDLFGGSTLFSNNNGFSFAGTPQYICRAHWNGLPYQPACDMYSFGIVMMELIIGRLNQPCKDHPFGFFNQFIESISGAPVNNGAKLLLDQSDDLVVWNRDDLEHLCKLALECLSKNPSERPTAQALASEVTNILLQGEIGGVPGSFVKSLSRREIAGNSSASRCAVCNEARTVQKKCSMSHILCDHCITHEAILASNNGLEEVPCPILQCKCRFDINKDLYGIVPKDIYDKINKKTSLESVILGYLKRIERGQNNLISQVSQVRKGVNRGLQAMASLTASGSSSCPNLVWLIPGSAIKIDVRKPQTWIQGLTDIPVRVYFICEHSFKPIDTPVTMTVPRKWLQKVAVALRISIFVLRLANLAYGLPLPVAGLDIGVDMLSTWTIFVDSMMEKAHQKLMEKVEPLFTKGFAAFDIADVKKLTGPAYELLADGVQTGGQLEWKDELKPVLNENGAHIWVRNKFVDHYKI